MIDSVGAASAASATPISNAAPGGKMGKDEFLKLFVAQMRHQDPLNPLEGQEMAAQLAQFSSVEQLIRMNETLAGQAASGASIVAAINSSSAMNAIGRTVTAIGNDVLLPEGGNASVSATVGGAGGNAVLKIYDGAGREVGSRSLGYVPAGMGTWELGSAAEGLPPGHYTYSLEVADAEGEIVPTQTYTVARIDGVRYGGDGPVLTAGSLSIPIGQVVQIATQG